MQDDSSAQTSDIVVALNESNIDEVSVKRFLELWPLIESLLKASSIITSLSTSAYLNDIQIFRFSVAGKVTDTCNITIERSRLLDIGTGVSFSISLSINEVERHSSVLASQAPLPFEQHEGNHAEQHDNEGNINFQAAKESYSQFADAVLDIVQQLLQDKIILPSFFTNMAHEICIILLGMGLLVEEMGSQINKEAASPNLPIETLLTTQSHIRKECQLGLYVIRNFLSHTSERQYEKAVTSHYTPLDLNVILLDMISLHGLHAEKKGIELEVQLGALPQVRGEEMEIRRLFHNILNNAIKYSYHSTPSTRRTIKIRSRIPFDPGFK